MPEIDEKYSNLEKHDLYFKIIKGRRSNRGNRWLSMLWPTDSEAKETFVPTYAYLNYIGPNDVAGNHFHKIKKEIFCPFGELELHLENPKTGKKQLLKISIGNKKFYEMIYIPPEIAHAVRNPTNQFVPLVVLANKPDSNEDSYIHKVF